MCCPQLAETRRYSGPHERACALDLRRLARPKLKVTCGLWAIFGISLACAPTVTLAEGQFSLNDLEAGVARDYGAITHVTPEQFEAVMGDPTKVLLLDARPANEFGISRIPGAIEVDPNIGADAFLVRFGDLVRGRDVIIYCSAGVRSSRLATRVRATLQKHGA